MVILCFIGFCFKLCEHHGQKKKKALKPADVGGCVCVCAFVYISVYVNFIELLRTRSPQGGNKREVLPKPER